MSGTPVPDVGYGLGWTLQAGSLVPVSGSGIAYYLFTDSTGAEYRLDNNPSGSHLWSSKEGVYVTYDDSTNKLHSNDGSFWIMGSISSPGEPDAGTMYPTLIEDSNGNQLS